ncbi:MAG: hypothetical protein M1429_00860 [Patescibacteria group bacterium]|nr:hypothetical protein [Patescibacteria group bacterium]
MKKGLTMSEDMLSKTLVRELPGLMRDFMKKVLGDNGQEWIEAFKRFLKKQNPWSDASSSKPAKKRLKVLQPLKAVAEFLMTLEFRAADNFSITPQDQKTTAEVVIGFLNDNFKNAFLANGGKVETSIFDSKLRPYRLKKASVDGPIIADLGGEEKVETTLAEMFTLMKAQGCGRRGILLTNGYANIFYVRDAKGILWVVSCAWFSDDQFWLVRAYPITDLSTWNAERQVFSRDFGS